MKYLNNLRYIEIALFISFLPLFFTIPFFMKLFVIVGILNIVFYKKNIFIPIFGFIMLFLSFYSSFNVAGLFFETFVKFLISLLSFGVILQLLEKKINFYLILSPFLFMMFSLFLYHNIYMLFYIVFEIWIFIVLLLLSKIDNLKIALKEGSLIFLFSLPFVILMFLFFPRFHLNFNKFGFKSNSYVGTVFSKDLEISDKNIIKSNRIVMEVKFLNKIPNSLYFRGNVLSKNIGKIWYEEDSKNRAVLGKSSNLIVYQLKQYPTNQKFIFALDLPIEAPTKSMLNNDFVIKSYKPLVNVENIRMNSYTDFTIKQKPSKITLFFDKNHNLDSQKIAKQFLKIKNPEQRLKKIEQFFIKQKIKYTLSPKNLDGYNIVDSLFKQKEGYCIHFASAFALFCRMAGIHSRIVTGFLGDKNEMYKNYLVIKEKDAHAWVEVNIDNEWRRVEPTNFAYSEKLSNNKNIERNSITKSENHSFMSKFELFIMYSRFNIEYWVLNYNYFKQQKFFKFLNNREFLMKFIGIVILVIVFILFLYFILKREKCEYEEICLMNKLLKKLKYKRTYETFEKILSSYNDEKLNEIKDLFNKIHFYKSSKDDIKKLKRLIKEYNFKKIKEDKR